MWILQFTGVLAKCGLSFWECGCFTFLLFTESFPTANKYATISPILEKCLLLTQLPPRASSPFLCITLHQNSPKRLPIPVNASLPFHPKPTFMRLLPSSLHQNGASKAPLAPCRQTWVHSWSSSTHRSTDQVILFDPLSSLGFHTALFGFPHPTGCSFCLLSCFLSPLPPNHLITVDVPSLSPDPLPFSFWVLRL